VFWIINLIFSSYILSLMEVTGEFLRVFLLYLNTLIIVIRNMQTEFTVFDSVSPQCVLGL
jgi:hypothetical protein